MARLDAGDVALPGQFAKQLAFLEANPEYALIGGQALLPKLLPNHSLHHEAEIVGQDKGAHRYDEAFLGQGTNPPGKGGVEGAPHRFHHPPPHHGQVGTSHPLFPLRIPMGIIPWAFLQRSVETALVPLVQVALRPLGRVQGEEKESGQAMKAFRGQVHLVGELPVVHQEVELQAVEGDPLPGDKDPVVRFWARPRAWLCLPPRSMAARVGWRMEASWLGGIV
ncbi:hypothetical protein Thermus77927_05620 [Thermus hydrothermalis]